MIVFSTVLLLLLVGLVLHVRGTFGKNNTGPMWADGDAAAVTGRSPQPISAETRPAVSAVATYRDAAQQTQKAPDSDYGAILDAVAAAPEAVPTASMRRAASEKIGRLLATAQAPADTPVAIDRFEPQEDVIVLAYDPARSPAPQIELQRHGNTATVLFNGSPVARVRSASAGLSLSDVRLLERSA